MKRGFTLVELSIAIVIIGLLIGGILIAQSIIETNRIQALVRETQQINVQTRLFKDRYKSLPGDFNRAEEVWGSTACQPSPGGCDGDNNGLIDGQYEMMRAWNHLYLGGITKEVYDEVGYTPTTPQQRNMESKVFKGMLYVFNANPFASVVPGNYLQLGRWFDYYDGSVSGDVNRPAFAPKIALAYDSKIDDGNSLSGSFISYTNPVHLGDCQGGGVYNVANDQVSCLSFQRLDADLN